MKRACTAALGKVTDGVLLECPVPLGENFESMGFGGFSKARTIFLGGGLVGSGKRFNFLQITSGGGCGVFDGLHRTERDLGSVFPYCNRSRHDEKTSFY